MCTSIAMKWGGGYSAAIWMWSIPLGNRWLSRPGRVSAAVLAAAGAGRALCPDRDGPHGRRPPSFTPRLPTKGAVYAGLNFPGSAWYEPDPPADCDAVAPYELIPWVLGSCATLTEAKARLARFRPLGVPLAADLPLAPLHWHIADRTGALVLEATREGVRLYDDPVGVLTNNPPFPFHQLNLSQYQHLTARPTENRLAPALPLEAFGQGMGAIGPARRRLARVAVCAGGVLQAERPRPRRRAGTGVRLFPTCWTPLPWCGAASSPRKAMGHDHLCLLFQRRRRDLLLQAPRQQPPVCGAPCRRRSGQR